MFNKRSFFHLPVLGFIFVFYIFLLGTLFFIIQVEAIRYAFKSLGISSEYVFLFLLLCIAGSMFNIPIKEIKSSPRRINDKITGFMNWRFKQLSSAPDRTIIAINVGGALIPVFISVYLAITHPSLLLENIISILVVSGFVHSLARPVPGVGIGVPLLLPPVLAALLGGALGGEFAPVVAYVGGTMGTLIGADILNIRSIARSGASFASIGGAGTFDGIFLTGIIAVLLASV